MEIYGTVGSVSAVKSNQPGLVRVWLTGTYDAAAKAVEKATGEHFVGRRLEDYAMSVEDVLTTLEQITGLRRDA